MKDCFAYINRRCGSLTVKKCEGKNCNFYKSKEQQLKDKEKAIERILSLDEYKIEHINKAYYKGKLEVN